MPPANARFRFACDLTDQGAALLHAGTAFVSLGDRGFLRALRDPPTPHPNAEGQTRRCWLPTPPGRRPPGERGRSSGQSRGRPAGPTAGRPSRRRAGRAAPASAPRPGPGPGQGGEEPGWSLTEAKGCYLRQRQKVGLEGGFGLLERKHRRCRRGARRAGKARRPGPGPGGPVPRGQGVDARRLRPGAPQPLGAARSHSHGGGGGGPGGRRAEAGSAGAAILGGARGAASVRRRGGPKRPRSGRRGPVARGGSRRVIDVSPAFSGRFLSRRFQPAPLLLAGLRVGLGSRILPIPWRTLPSHPVPRRGGWSPPGAGRDPAGGSSSSALPLGERRGIVSFPRLHEESNHKDGALRGRGGRGGDDVKTRTEAEDFHNLASEPLGDCETSTWGLQRQVFIASRGCLGSAVKIRLQHESTTATAFFLLSPFIRGVACYSRGT